MRELADGRVLLFDRKENELSVIDFSAGTRKQVSRIGQGPGEFQWIPSMHALGGDSTLAADGTTRWLILVGDSVVTTLPPDLPATREVGLWPLGADVYGKVLGRNYRSGASDSAPLLLIDRTSGKFEPVAKLRLGVRRAPMKSINDPESGRGVQVTRIPLDVQEAPLLLRDGWVAVVRLEPYRVDWRAPNGSWTFGSPISAGIKMTDGDREAYLKRRPGMRNATNWPEMLPPFETPTSVFGTPDGWLVIKRLSSAGATDQRYDLVDKTGVRRGQLSIRPNEAIIGFGASSVYVIETDDDGIQRLRRHPYSATSIRP